MMYPVRTMLRAAISRRFRQEAGASLLAVVLFGAGLAVVSTAMMSRGAAQFSNTSGHACWESSLTAAESALNWGAAQIEADPDFHTFAPDLSGVFGTADERPAAVAAADAVEAGEVMDMPEGQGVFLRAPGADALYGVGYCSDRDADDRRTRVVRATLSTIGGQAGFWTSTYAFLTDGDVEISGNPEFGDPEFVGSDSSVHANGSATAQGNVKFFDGCITWSSGGGGVGNNVNLSGECPQEPDRSTMDEVPIPPVVPREVWFKSEYDMCPDGEVYAGPAHPIHADHPDPPEEPCTGQFLSNSPYRGWSYQGHHSTHGHRWKAAGNGAVQSGSYYFFEGSVDVSGSQGSSSSPVGIILVAEAAGSCAANIGGDVEISGSAYFVPYTNPGVLETNQLLIMAGRDFKWTGTASALQSGLVMVHEQMFISGNKTAVGAFISEDACDTPGSPVSENVIHGNVQIMLDGEKTTDWVSGSGEGDDSYIIIGWVEVR